MKTLWNAVSILAVAHMLALIGFIGYLAGTDRLNRDRIDEVRALFAPTIAEARLAAEEEEKARLAGELVDGAPGATMRTVSNTMEQPSHGAGDRIAKLHTVDEMLRERENRFEKDREHLKRTLEEEMASLEKGWEDLKAARQAFQEELERQRELKEDEQFQKLVDMLSGLQGKDIKAKFDALLEQDDMALVIDLLDRFDKRIAQKVLKEYKSDEENALAADLLKRLKDRGISPVSP